jgi:hypothetical protein
MVKTISILMNTENFKSLLKMIIRLKVIKTFVTVCVTHGTKINWTAS